MENKKKILRLLLSENVVLGNSINEWCGSQERFGEVNISFQFHSDLTKLTNAHYKKEKKISKMSILPNIAEQKTG